MERRERAPKNLAWGTQGLNPALQTSEVSDEDMMQFVATHASQKFRFSRFPCRTQAVERCVKVVTEASAAVCGVKAGEGFIRARLESRRIMPTFNTKKEYRTA